MASHFECCSESRELCNSLFQRLNQKILNLKFSRSKNTCWFFDQGTRQFAVIYHHKKIGSIDIWCSGDLINLNITTYVDFRPRNKKTSKTISGWEKNFPGRFTINDNSK